MKKVIKGLTVNRFFNSSYSWLIGIFLNFDLENLVIAILGGLKINQFRVFEIGTQNRFVTF